MSTKHPKRALETAYKAVEGDKIKIGARKVLVDDVKLLSSNTGLKQMECAGGEYRIFAYRSQAKVEVYRHRAKGFELVKSKEF